MKSISLTNDNWAFVSIITLKPLINIRYFRFTIKIKKMWKTKDVLLKVMR